MKFTRSDLIARLEAEITRRHVDACERNAKNLAAFDQRRAEYLDRTTDAWRELGNAIRRRQRAGEPVTSDDIPRPLKNGYMGSYVATFDSTGPDEVVANVTHLHTLLALLRATTDEEISTASLDRMGLRLGDLFRERS